MVSLVPVFWFVGQVIVVDVAVRVIVLISNQERSKVKGRKLFTITGMRLFASPGLSYPWNAVTLRVPGSRHLKWSLILDTLLWMMPHLYEVNISMWSSTSIHSPWDWRLLLQR